MRVVMRDSVRTERRRYDAGQEYDLPVSDALDLITLGHAVEVDAEFDSITPDDPVVASAVDYMSDIIDRLPGHSFGALAQGIVELASSMAVDVRGNHRAALEEVADTLRDLFETTLTPIGQPYSVVLNAHPHGGFTIIVTTRAAALPLVTYLGSTVTSGPLEAYARYVDYYDFSMIQTPTAPEPVPERPRRTGRRVNI